MQVGRTGIEVPNLPCVHQMPSAPNLKPLELLEDIHRQISEAWDSVHRIQYLSYSLSSENDYRSGEYDLAQLVFESQLSRLHIALSALCEAVGLPLLRAQLHTEYTGIPENKRARLSDTPDGDLHSDVLARFSDYRFTLTSLLGKESSKEALLENLNKLEGVLLSTAKIVHDRKIEPSNEADVRLAIYQTLSAYFPDTVREVAIPQVTKTYKADVGVKSLKSAAEFKFANSENEVKTALGGIYEDMKGYEGSEDWRFRRASRGLSPESCNFFLYAFDARRRIDDGIAFWIERDRSDRRPVAGMARPPPRVGFAGL